MRRTAVLVVLCVLVAVGVGACGGTTTTSPAGAKLQTTTPHKVVKARRCPHAKAFMGCALGASPYSFKSLPGRALVPNPKSVGSVFPDVSSYQGCGINWSRIPVPGAIVKGWEFSTDPCLAHNAASLTAAHKRWAIYDFVRYCNASALISLYRRYHPPLPPVLDEEVSSAAGCTAPMASQIHAALGVWPVEYTSPGTEQSGASAYHLVLWEADYGPRYVCLWTCPKAWQFGSPPYIYYRIPGLGYGDVNRDMGLLELGVKPVAPPKCLAIRFPHTKRCYQIRYVYHRLRVDVARVSSRLRQHHCYRRQHSRYCGGWRYARHVDRAKLAALHKKYA